MIFLRACPRCCLSPAVDACAGAGFPGRLVRIVVPYPAGGGVDGLARPIADRLSKEWRQTVIVENNPAPAP